MGWLKGAVIGMGVLIFVGMGLLVYGVMVKTGGPKPGAGSGAGSASSAPAAFGSASVAVPPGCRVDDFVPDRDRVYLLIGPADRPGCDMAIVVDANSGRTLGTLRFRP